MNDIKELSGSEYPFANPLGFLIAYWILWTGEIMPVLIKEAYPYDLVGEIVHLQ